MQKPILLIALLLSITFACRNAQPTSPPSPSPTRTFVPTHTPGASATPTLPPQPSPTQPKQEPTPALPTDCRPIARYTEVFFYNAWIGPEFALSGDGSRLVFTYFNDDLVAGDSNGVPDVFLYDAGSDAISLVSVSSSGEQQDLPDYDKDNPNPLTQGRQSVAISADGRYVAFTSEAANLVSGVELEPGITHLYLRDLSSGQTSFISLDPDGAPLRTSAGAPSISADGRYTSFLYRDGFALLIYDRTTQTTREIPLSTTGEEPNERIYSAELSADGQHVVYASDAGNLVPGDNDRAIDVFVKDLQSGKIVRISVVPDHITIEQVGIVGIVDGPSISADGSVVAFAYESTEFSDPALTREFYIFTYDAHTGQTTPVQLSMGGLPVGMVWWDIFNSLQLTSDGSQAIFVTTYYNPQLNDALLTDALIYNSQTGETVLASLGSDGSGETGDARHAAISPDGSTVALVATSYIPAAGLDPIPLLLCTWP